MLVFYCYAGDQSKILFDSIMAESLQELTLCSKIPWSMGTTLLKIGLCVSVYSNPKLKSGKYSGQDMRISVYLFIKKLII